MIRFAEFAKIPGATINGETILRASEHNGVVNLSTYEHRYERYNRLYQTLPDAAQGVVIPTPQFPALPKEPGDFFIRNGKLFQIRHNGLQLYCQCLTTDLPVSPEPYTPACDTIEAIMEHAK